MSAPHSTVVEWGQRNTCPYSLGSGNLVRQGSLPSEPSYLVHQKNIFKCLWCVCKSERHRMCVEAHRTLFSISAVGSREQTEVIRRSYACWTWAPGPQQDFIQSICICGMYFLCGELISPLKSKIIGSVFSQQTLVFWSLTAYAQHLFFFLVWELTFLTSP